MATERDADLEMVQILDQTDRHQDMIDIMKRVIDLNPCLTADERALLSVSYKNVISVRRDGLRMLSGLLEQDQTKENPRRVEQVTEYRKKITSELDAYCLELIQLVDEKLLPEAKDAEARLFYEKLKGDYFRYVAESKEGEERQEYSEKARKEYEKALETAEKEIQPHEPAYLGLILNYSVYLCEIAGQKQEAIELAKKTYNECSETVEANKDETFQEATNILQLLKDNVASWEGAEK